MQKNLNRYTTEKRGDYSEESGGARARSKGTGSGPVGVGLRGFKSHPPHHS